MATNAANELWRAVQRRDLAECQRLMDAGVPVDSVGGVCHETVLGVAARNGHLDVVALLLDNGASVDKGVVTFGETPLMDAARNGFVHVVALLLEHDASATAASSLMFMASRVKRTALYFAATHRHVACVQALLAATLPKGVAA